MFVATSSCHETRYGDTYCDAAFRRQVAQLPHCYKTDFVLICVKESMYSSLESCELEKRRSSNGGVDDLDTKVGGQSDDISQGGVAGVIPQIIVRTLWEAVQNGAQQNKVIRFIDLAVQYM